jgi:hypothetical protein
MTDEKPADILTFDNVRPARLTLDEALSGGIGVWLFDATVTDGPAVDAGPQPSAEVAGPSEVEKPYLAALDLFC